MLYPTNWYVLIHIYLCLKKEIDSWRYLSPSWLSHCPLVVFPSCPASLIAIALAGALSIACRHRALRCRRRVQPPRCCCAAAVALCATAKLPSPPCRPQAAATAAAAATAPPFVGWLLHFCPPSDFVIPCRHATVEALIAGVNIFVQIGTVRLSSVDHP